MLDDQEGRFAKIRFFDKNGTERSDDVMPCHPFVDAGFALPGTPADGQWSWSLAMIDTGLSITLVDQAIIDRLGVLPAGEMTLTRADGLVRLPHFKIDVRLGQALVTTSAMVGCQRSGIGHPTGVRCLIGLDILRLGRLLIESPETGQSRFEFQLERIVRPQQ